MRPSKLFAIAVVAVLAMVPAACSRPAPPDLVASATPPASAPATVEAAPSASASAVPSVEPTTAPYLPPDAASAAPEPEAPRKTIGTLKDWVKAYAGMGAAEQTPPPQLRMPRDLAVKSGLLAFERSGNIFTFDLAKGEEAQLTRDAQRNRYAEFLHDGRRIVFQSNRDGMAWRFFIMNADGSGQRALTGKIRDSYGSIPFAISPDDRTLAYLGAGGDPGVGPQRLHLVDTESGKDEAVGEWSFYEDPTFSPRGDELYLVGGGFDSESVHALNVGTRLMRRLPNAGFHMFSAPQRTGDRLLFSASGTAAYCCRSSSLYTTALDGSGIAKFGDFSAPGGVYPKISPRGKKIAVGWSVREGGFGADWRTDITVTKADGTGGHTLSSMFPRPFYSGGGPVWAPDDRHVAFTLSLCPYIGCEPTIRSVVVVDTEDPGAVPAFIAYGGVSSWSPVP